MANKGTIQDQGQTDVQFKIGEREGFVVLDFGKPTQWIALAPEDMIDLAAKLVNVAEKIKAEHEATVS